MRDGYGSISWKEWSAILDLLDNKAVENFEQSDQSNFGLLEKLGPTWGMRGQYRKTLRLILYSDD